MGCFRFLQSKLIQMVLWLISRPEKIRVLDDNHTWDLITLPPVKKVMGCFELLQSKSIQMVMQLG